MSPARTATRTASHAVALRRRVDPGALAVVVVLVLVAVPVAAVGWRSIHVDGTLSTEAFARLLSSPRTWRLVGVTVAQAVASALAAVVVGVPLAWVLSRWSFRGATLVRTALTVPFVLPSVVIGAAVASVLGPRGLVDLRGTWWPILYAHLAFNLSVVTRTVAAALRTVDDELEPAARVLGAGPFAAARRVVLPAVAPAIASAAVVVFLFCLTSFGVVVVLGGGAVTTLEVEIWTRATRQFDLSGAGVLAMVQFVAVLATLALHARIGRRRSVGGGDAPLRRVGSTGARLAVTGAVVTVMVVSVLPLAALVERSFRIGTDWTIANWTALGSVTAGTGLAVTPWATVQRSIVSATVATMAALVLALPAARSVARRQGGIADRVLLLPLGVSATTIGLGLLLALGRPPLDLRGSWWVVPLGQALVALPLVVRALVPALRGIPTSTLDAAALLGAGPLPRWWRVELPLVRRALAAGTGLAAVACLGEFGATVFLSRRSDPTVPVAIERLLSRPGGVGFGQGMALSCVLMVMCALVVAAIDRWLAGRDGELAW